MVRRQGPMSPPPAVPLAFSWSQRVGISWHSPALPSVIGNRPEGPIPQLLEADVSLDEGRGELVPRLEQVRVAGQ